MGNPYIDVRGPYPILFIGMVAIVLTEHKRGVTVEEALNWIGVVL